MTTPTRDELLKLAKEAGFKTSGGFVESKYYHCDITDELAAFTALLSAHQAQAEPAAWQVRFVDLEEGPSLWQGCSEGAAETYRKKERCEVRALYPAPPSSDQTWNEAIEAAAAICDAQATVVTIGGEGEYNDGRSMAATVCASMIRSLARPSQAQEPSDGEFTDVRKRLPERGQRIQGVSCSGAWIETFDPDEPIGHMTHWRPVDTDANDATEQPVSGAVDEQAQRLAFEEWAKPRGYSLERTTDSYKSQGTKSAWRGWFAHARKTFSRAQQAPAVSGEQQFRMAPYPITDELGRTDYMVGGRYLPASVICGVYHAIIRRCAPASQPAAAPVSEQTDWMRTKFFTKEQSQ